MKCFVIIFLSQLIIHVSNAQTALPDWILIYSKDGDSVFIRTEVQPDEEGIRNWTKSIRKNIEIGGKVHKNAKHLSLTVYDCEQKQTKTIQSIIYNSAGKIIHSYTYKLYEQEWTASIPESMGELMLTAVCMLNSKINKDKTDVKF